MLPSLWIIAEHEYGKHPFLWATATYCFDTKEEAEEYQRFNQTDPTRTHCYYMPMPVWFTEEELR
jgi:hypothetical protein